MVKWKLEVNRLTRRTANCLICNEFMDKGELASRLLEVRYGESVDSTVHIECLPQFLSSRLDEPYEPQSPAKRGVGRPPLDVTDDQRKARTNLQEVIRQTQDDLVLAYIDGKEAKIKHQWFRLLEKLEAATEDTEVGPNYTFEFNHRFIKVLEERDPNLLNLLRAYRKIPLEGYVPKSAAGSWVVIAESLKHKDWIGPEMIRAFHEKHSDDMIGETL